MEMATLTNGAKVPVTYVSQTLIGLEYMAATYSIMEVYELLELCKDPNHQPSGVTGDKMYAFGFLTEWNPGTKRAVVQDLTRDVVLAAVQGEGPNLSITRQIIVSTEEVDDA